MRVPAMEDIELIRRLRAHSEHALKVDGDRDHMNGSNLTCEHTQVMAKLMVIASNRLEQATLTAGQTTK